MATVPYRTALQRTLDASRKRAKRRKRVDDIIFAFMVVVLISGGALLSAWLIMLLFGSLHHSVASVVPAYGYGASIIIIFTVAAIKGLVEVFRRGR